MRLTRRTAAVAAGASFVLASGLGAAFADPASTPITAEAASFSLTTNSKDTVIQACTANHKPNGIVEVEGKVWGPFTAAGPSDTSTGTTDPRLNGTGLLEYTIDYQPSDGNGVMDGHLHIFRNAPAAGQEPSGPQTANGEVHATLVPDQFTARPTPPQEFMDGFMLLHLEDQAAGSTAALPPGELYANFTSNVNATSGGLQVVSGKLGDTFGDPSTNGRDNGPSDSWIHHDKNNAAMFIADAASC